MTRRANEQQGMFATEAVADIYDLEIETGIEDWYDAVNPRTGAKYESKSTHEGGRFRLWEDQIRSLIASNARGTAWVAFVLLDGSGSVVDVQRREPGTVLEIVNERGGWNRAGHEERDGCQHKLPAEEVMA